MPRETKEQTLLIKSFAIPTARLQETGARHAQICKLTLVRAAAAPPSLCALNVLTSFHYAGTGTVMTVAGVVDNSAAVLGPSGLVIRSLREWDAVGVFFAKGKVSDELFNAQVVELIVPEKKDWTVFK